MEGDAEVDVLLLVQQYLRGEGFRLADLALLEERSRRAGGEVDGEEADNLLNEVRIFLRSKGFHHADLALQEERSSRGSGGGLEGEEAENLLKEVQLYLRRKGFGLTERALQEERCRRATTFGLFRSLTCRPDDYAGEIYVGYQNLSAWANGPHDDYKHEFVSVLYPLFLQCSADLVARGYTAQARKFFFDFVEDHEPMFSEELRGIKGILSATNLEKVVLPSTTKIRVKLCEFSYELLLQYLHRRNAVLLGMINEKIKFEVCAGRPFVFPLGKETMAEMVSTASASALVAISTLNLIAAKIQDCDGDGYPVARALVSTLPYTYLPLGLVGVALGVGAVKNQRLIDYAAGGLLLQLIYLICLGWLRALSCRRLDVARVGYTVLGYITFLLIGWSFCCAHPMSLRSLGVCAYRCTFKKIGSGCVWAYRRCTRPRATSTVRAPENPQHDLEANAVMSSVTGTAARLKGH